MEFNTREGAEDFVSATQQMQPDRLLQMEPYQMFLIIAIGAEPDECGRGEAEDYCHRCSDHALFEGSPTPLMRFCPMCDQWRSVYGEQTLCSLCNNPCEVTQDAMSKLPEDCNFRSDGNVAMIPADPALRWDTLPHPRLQGLSLSIQPNSFSLRCYAR